MPQCLPTGIRALFASAVLDISVGGLAYVLCLQRRLDISVSGLPPGACQAQDCGRMSSFSESEPVFKTRCSQVGLDASDMECLVKAGVNSLAKVAFMTSYTPGSGEDKDLIAAFETAIGKPASLGQKSSFRRLFHEAFAVTTNEMKMLVERTDETVPRKLSVPERAERFELIRKRLPGLSIRNRLEPSDSLVDALVSQYEQDRIQFLQWDRLTSKEQELCTSARRESIFSIDSTGKLKTEAKADVKADTSAELLLQHALQRRGIALEMSNLLNYDKHYLWVERLLSARLDPLPSTHCLPTFDQLRMADAKLWQLLAEKTRKGVQCTAAGRPLDSIFEAVSQSPEVLHILQPLPKSSGAPKFHDIPDERPERPGPYSGKGRKKGKGRGKGKLASKSTRVPSALAGTRSHTNAGEAICFGYGLKTCRETCVRNRCPRGLHICGFPGCGQTHPALDCPKRAQFQDGVKAA